MPHATAGRDAGARVIALVIAACGLALCASVAFALTSAAAQDRFGGFVYEAGAWLLLLCVGPFLPLGRTVFVGALFALGLEGFAHYRRFVPSSPSEDAAAIDLRKPTKQLTLIAAWKAAYLTYLRAQRGHG